MVVTLIRLQDNLAGVRGPVESRVEIEVASHVRNLRRLFAGAAQVVFAVVTQDYFRAE